MKVKTTSNENNEPPREMYSAIIPDPGVPTTFEEAFLFGDQQYMKNSLVLSAGKPSRKEIRNK
jgi:hypothetical protein